MFAVEDHLEDVHLFYYLFASNKHACDNTQSCYFRLILLLLFFIRFFMVIHCHYCHRFHSLTHATSATCVFADRLIKRFINLFHIHFSLTATGSYVFAPCVILAMFFSISRVSQSGNYTFLKPTFFFAHKYDKFFTDSPTNMQISARLEAKGFSLWKCFFLLWNWSCFISFSIIYPFFTLFEAAWNTESSNLEHGNVTFISFLFYSLSSFLQPKNSLVSSTHIYLLHFSFLFLVLRKKFPLIFS